jgi:DNA-binding NarL/FixJ family response regulator
VNNTESKSISVAIVEDEHLFRDLLRIALSNDPALDVVDNYGTVESALAGIDVCDPDVAVIDIDLGDSINGIQLGLLLREKHPGMGIVILSNHADPNFLTAVNGHALKGWSYLLKKSLGDVAALRRAIRGSVDQLIVLDPQLVSLMKTRSSGLEARLTPRQLQVLDLIAQGYTNTGIADLLKVTEKSIENQINQLYQALDIDRSNGGIHPRVKAVLIYLEESRANQLRRPAGAVKANAGERVVPPSGSLRLAGGVS